MIYSRVKILPNSTFINVAQPPPTPFWIFRYEKNLPGNAVFILENVFETGLNLPELSERYLVAVSSRLKEKNNLLILTSNYPDERLAELTVLNHLNAHIVDLTPMFARYLDYYHKSEAHQLPEPLVDLAKKNSSELLRKLQSPLQIEQFCIKLSQLTTESESGNKDETDLSQRMIALADGVGNTSQETLRQCFAVYH